MMDRPTEAAAAAEQALAEFRAAGETDEDVISDVMIQFLVEAVVLSSLGGIIGII
jgi:hypothetical protein